MTSRLYWNPLPLNLAIERGYQASLQVVQADAKATSGHPEADADVSVTGPTTAELRATGRLGPIFEEGARPHEIEGSKGFLYIGGGRFVSGTVHHPGSPPKPYIGPAAQRWAAGGCQTVLRGSLAAGGF